MSIKKNILVTGANGQLGKEFAQLANQYGSYNFTFVSKVDLLIDDYERVESFFKSNQFDICINCAAYTAVDKAESEPEKAFAVNAFGASNLAVFCEYHKMQLFHFSTDYVVDGTHTTPITEDAITNPQTVYGRSKLKGEQLVLQINPSAIIIRTSWVYSQYGNNFVKTMLRVMKEKESINVVDDQIGCPTYAADLANAVMQIIETNTSNTNGGIYNYCNEGSISWYQFAAAIKQFVNSNCIVHPIATAQYPTAAKRPTYSVLNTALIKNSFGVIIPSWSDSLQKCLQLLN
jgi:dTDP-4-dehydrorhamnose reductase